MLIFLPKIPNLKKNSSGLWILITKIRFKNLSKKIFFKSEAVIEIVNVVVESIF